MASIAQTASTREGLAARLLALQEYESRLNRNIAALKANTADARALKSLDDVERDAATLSAQLEATAAQLTIESHGPTKVMVNGNAIKTNTEVRPVTEPVSIMVGDQATITITPPQTSLTSSRLQQDALRQRLNDILVKYGCTNPTELRKKHGDYQSNEADSRGLKTEQTALGLKDPLPAGEIALIAAEIAQIDSDTKSASEELGEKALPSVQDIEKNRDSLRDAREQLRTKRNQCEGVVTGQNAILSRIATMLGTLRGQLSEIEGQLTLDLSVLPDNQRQRLFDEADKEYQTKSVNFRIKSEQLEEMLRSAPSPDKIENLRLRVIRLTEALNNRGTQISSLNEQIANLEGHIQAAGGDGLGEKSADLKAQVIIAKNELARQIERTETLSLLRDIVQQKYDSRREQLHAPLRRFLKPFLNDMFPDAEIEIGEGFAVSGMRRTPPHSEMFEKLSAGTQEQIAVLIRLAMGAMISERGQEVPIVLDDALVFSDDTRIEQMFDALSRAGKNQQVIILTCRTRTFSSLGGKQLHIAS